MPSVIGIDISSHAIDLVKLDETTNDATWLRVELIGGTSFARLRQVAPQMPRHSFFDDVYLAAIETPKTRFMKSAGAIFPVYGAVVAMLPAALEVWDVHPKSWRLELGLAGNASKTACAVAVQKLRRRWDIYPRPLEPWPQDALDAYAVAHYARTINARGLSAA